MADPLYDTRQVANAVSTEFPSDVAEAVKQGLERVKALPNFQALQEHLLYTAMQSLVYAARHQTNVRIKRQTGYYDEVNQQKVSVEESETVKAAYIEVYSYRIGSTVLGCLTGRDLPRLVASERNRAEGHEFNAKLLQWLIDQGVTGTLEVREVVPEEVLRTHFRRIHREVYGQAA